MMSHESTTPISPADFAVQHDGTQSAINERERAVTSTKFASLIDDTLLNFAGEVKHYRNLTPQDSLLLQLPVNETDRYIIGLIAKTEPSEPSTHFSPDEQTVKELSLQKISDNLGGEYISYRLCADGVVRRYDGSNGYAKIQEKRALGIEPRSIMEGMSRQEALAIAATNLEHLMNDISNTRLERKMGYQNQPIGLQELDGLADFMQQPDIVASPLY